MEAPLIYYTLCKNQSVGKKLRENIYKEKSILLIIKFYVSIQST